MYFTLHQAIRFFFVPSNVIAAVAMLGLVMMAFRRRSGAIVATVGLAALVVGTLSPLGNMLLTPLEQRFPEGFPDPPIDGIIVLGGSYDTVSHSYLSTIVLEEDTEAMAIIPDLARRYPRAQIIVSGGNDPWVPGPSDAAIIERYFVSFGIPADRISIEERSLTTEQNARFTAQLIHPAPQSRWLLVTSAYHIPRAMGAFRRAGFSVVAFPTGFRSHGWHAWWWPENTAVDNLRRVDVAVHEWLGLSFYRLSGYSDEWFPGP